MCWLRDLWAVVLLALATSTASVAADGVVRENDSTNEAEDEAEAEAEAEEIVVYGIRTGTLDSIPGATTSTLFVDDFRAENMDLAELLSQAEGINVRRFGGPGDSSEISIRGSSPSQVVVTIDGVRANSMLTGGLDLSRVCLPMVDRVEITRGAGGTQEGSGAVGGVVNVVTRAAEAEPTTRASFAGGSFETYEGSLLVANRAGSLDYSVGYCGLTTEGDFEFARPVETTDGIPSRFEPDSARRLNNERVQHGASLGLGLPVGPGTLRLSDYAVYSSGGEPGIDSGNGASAGQALHAHARDLSNLAQLRWQAPTFLRAAGEFDATLYHRFEKTSFRNPDAVFTDPIDVETRLSTVGTRLHEKWTDDLFGAANELDLRFDHAYDSLDSDDQSDRDRHRVAGAATESLGLLGETLELSAGLRLDWTQGFSVQLLPEFGVVYSPWKWIRVRGHAARAYRAPTFDELFHPDEGSLRGNPDLRPEDAWNFDVGGDLLLAALGPFSDLSFRASWFRRELDESIVWVRVNQRTVAPRNTGAATSEGFEVAVSISWTRYVQLSANHTDTDSRRDANGKRLPGQPTYETTARLRLGPEGFWKLVGEMQRVGDILVNTGGTRRLPDRTVWNASAALDLVELPFGSLDRWASEVWVFGEVNNLSDVAVRDSISFPQPGRHVAFGFEVTW